MTADTFLEWLAGGEGPPPRTAVIVAHPDDEVVGLGSQLRRLGDAWFVHVTDGSPRNGRDAATWGLDTAGYALARRQEAERALALVGVPAARIVGFWIPDQQGALHLVDITRRIRALVTRHEIEVVVTQPYEGGHPDHDATAFAVHAALLGVGRPVALVEMTAYHRGPLGTFVGGGGLALPVDRVLRQRLLACHRTQRATLEPLADPEYERFREAPTYDFRRPPHQGPLLYEAFDRGVTAERFRALAAEARVALGIR